LTKLYNRLKKILEKVLNKHSDKKFGQGEICTEIKFIIKQPSKEVLKLARKFKNNVENDENLYENDIHCPNVQVENDDLCIRFEKFMIENSIGEKRPSNFDIERHLNIDSERKRKELIEFGVNKGFLIRKNATTTIFNINYEIEDVG
jgi:hypothetical protein